MSCPCCAIGTPIASHLEEEPTIGNMEHSHFIEYFMCPSCGVLFKGTMPDKLKLRNYYENAWQFSLPRPSRCFDSAAEWISEHIKHADLSIDVGAKNSDLLLAMAKYGTSIDLIDVIDAKPTSSGVKPAWVGEGYVTDKRYDLVVATHILEHAIDPMAFLRDIFGMMADSGILYVEVPSLEIGWTDTSACDDINPNHLWHFTLQSLCALMRRSGLMVLKAGMDGKASGWPCNRVLAKKTDIDSIEQLRGAISSAYSEARRTLQRDIRNGDALYGASHSCWKLMRSAPWLDGVPLYDLYKVGKCGRSEIRHPSLMERDGIKRVWITPRFWNSMTEIGKWLEENHPSIERLSPYKQ